MATPAAASDWIRYWDEASSDYYYHRPATGETSWEQPDRWICGEGYDSPEDSARRSRAGSSLPLEDEDDVDAPEEDLFVVRASLSGPPPLPAGGPPPFSFGAPPPLPVPATEPSSAQREERRRRVLGEILSTERTYVAALQTLDKVYMVPMRMVADAGAKVAIFSHADLDTVFLNLDVLLKLHTRFLERLEQEEASGHFGAILSGAAKDIKGCYTRYISNYAQAEAHISALASKAPDKHRYLEVCKSHPDAGGLDVRSFLIQPIQRVPRYRLLLEELIAHTEPGHPDEADLREALTRIREVAAFINEETRVSATLCKLREVARRFAQPEVLEKSLVRQGRAFVREGELTKVFLFSDLLVYGVPTGRGYVQKGQIPLGEGTRVERLPRTEHLTHGFAVVDGHGKGYTWHGESEAETGEWFEEVQRAVRACQPERRPSSFDAVAILAMVARKTALEHFTAAKAGCTLIKFNHRDGRSSPRWVRLSADGSAICWADTKSKECKSMMALSKAVALMHGAKSAAFYRAQSAKKDRDWLCFSLLFRGRTLDFAATTAEGLFTWYLALAALVGPRSSEPILDEEALRARVAEMI